MVRKYPGKAFNSAVRAKAEIAPDLFENISQVVIGKSFFAGEVAKFTDKAGVHYNFQYSLGLIILIPL